MKILIVTKNWLGDSLFEFPAIDALKAEYLDSEIVCLAPPRCREILLMNPSVSRVLEFDEKGRERSLLARIFYGLKLRREKFDLAVLFHRSRTRAFITFLAGAKKRIGYGLRRRLFLTNAVAEPETPMHHVDYFLRLVVHLSNSNCISSSPHAVRRGSDSRLKPCGSDEKNYHLTPSQEALETVKDSFAKLGIDRTACFHLGANWEPKRWPPAHFAKLADLIYERWGYSIILTGGESDRGLAESVISQIKKAKVHVCAGQTSLSELAAIFKRAEFVVSGDSGPMHIASSVGTRVVALFGPTNPDLTGPRGRGEALILKYVPPGLSAPWYGKDFPDGGWLENIQPEEVMREIEKKWYARPAGDGNVSTSSSPHALRRGSPNIDSRLKACGNDEETFRGDDTKNILLVTLSNIGDCILTTPALAALKSQFSDSHLTLVCGPKAEGLFRGSKLVDRLILYDKHSGLGEQIRFLQSLRERSYEMVVDLRHTAIPYLVNAKRRSPLFRNLKSVSMRERHLEVLAKMGLETKVTTPFDFFSEEDKESVKKVILRATPQGGCFAQDDIILVSAAAQSALKTWKLEGFREVISTLVRERNEDIVLIGDSREREIVSSLVEIAPERIFNLAGQTSLRELAALISQASLLITNDSAAMHLAHALNRPTVAIFGPTDHAKYGRTGPHFKIVREEIACSPCGLAECRFERQHCFEDLKTAKVIEECRKLLRAPSPMVPGVILRLAPLGEGGKRRILITRADRIGDLVLSTPVFQALREKYPDAHVACLTFLENRELVEGNPYLNEVILYDKKGSEKGIIGQVLFARKIAQKKFDTVIHLHSTNRMHWLSWLAGIPVRIGWNRKLAWSLTHGFADIKSEGRKHEAEYNFHLLEPLGVPAPEEFKTYFPLTERSERSLDSLFIHLGIEAKRPLIAIHPSASCPSKIWPADRFGRLIGKLREKVDADFILIGSAQDRKIIDQVKKSSPVPTLDLSGRLGLGTLGAFLKRAKLLISNDSGPVHIAQAVGTPVVSIFGRNLPGLSVTRWRPLGKNSKVVWKNVGCDPCLAHECEINFLCLDAVSVKDVMKEVEWIS